MKIGIITFHNAYNYGAVLQAFATQSYIESLGHEAEIIDYHNKWIDADYDFQKFSIRRMPKRAFYRAPAYVIEKFYYFLRRKKYDRFKKSFLNIGPHQYYDKSEIILDGFDAVLIGSDQLWNTELTRGYDDVYWGDFSSPHNTKVLTWAVSMNSQELNECDVVFIHNHLKNFNAISVREPYLKDLLTSVAHSNITTLLDPVFLVPVDKWDRLCRSICRKNYILVYAILYKEQAISFARYLAELYHKDVVIINTFSGNSPARKEEECLGPTDFLSYLKNADFIVTTSFHGCAFSLIFEKRFYCIEPEGSYNIRVHSLLKTFNEENRIISGDSIPCHSDEDLNSSFINEIIELNGESARSFLESTL